MRTFERNVKSVLSNVRKRRMKPTSETTFAERLKSLHEGESLSSFAERIGESDTTLGNYERGTRLPKADFLARLKSAVDVDLNWLVFGTEDQSQSSPPSTDQFSFVPRLEIRASAGSGAIAVTEETDSMLAFRSEWLRRRGINPAAASVLTATGDSNEPTIRDGDILLVDTSIRQIRDNGFYIVVISELVFVKRVHLSMDGSVTLLSDNDVYPPERVAKADVQDLYLAGRVMWFGRAL